MNGTPLFPDDPEDGRTAELRRSACRSSVYRDDSPDMQDAAPDLVPVGRNADHARVYLGPDQGVRIGHYSGTKFYATPSTDPARDLAEARAWTRMRVDWDRAHGRTDDED